MDKELIGYMRSVYKNGDRVKLINMAGEDRMKYGDEGIITGVDDAGQIHVKWDDKGLLAIQLNIDDFIKL